MRELPILFSAPMVRALLDGSKTQTRRVMSLQPEEDAAITVERFHQTVVNRHGEEQPGLEVFGAWWHDGEHGLKCPYGPPGDRLWVRETHAPQPDCWGAWERWTRGDGGPGPIIHYKASDEHAWVDQWRPSIHMPRWASRMLLEVVSVRVERLQAISEADARAEGAPSWASEQQTPVRDLEEARLQFRALWTEINGGESWDVNPWVWCVAFKRVKP